VATAVFINHALATLNNQALFGPKWLNFTEITEHSLFLWNQRAILFSNFLFRHQGIDSIAIFLFFLLQHPALNYLPSCGIVSPWGITKKKRFHKDTDIRSQNIMLIFSSRNERTFLLLIKTTGKQKTIAEERTNKTCRWKAPGVAAHVAVCFFCFFNFEKGKVFGK